MKKETVLWQKQAIYELRVAKKLSESFLYSAFSFHAHQSAEMSLKALHHEKIGLTQTHDLNMLARLLKAPPYIQNYCGKLNPVYQETRYPDVNNKAPSEEYTEDDAREDINMAEEILNWTEKEIKSSKSSRVLRS